MPWSLRSVTIVLLKPHFAASGSPFMNSITGYTCVCVCVCVCVTVCIYIVTIQRCVCTQRYTHRYTERDAPTQYTSTYLLCSIYHIYMYTRTSLLMSFSRRAFNGSMAEPCNPGQAFSKVSTSVHLKSVNLKSVHLKSVPQYICCIKSPFRGLLRI